MATQVWARRPFQYGDKQLDRGQVFDLTGSRNDERLLRLGYVEEIKRARKDLHECAACGALFVGGNERAGHYERRHVRVNLSPDEEDRRIDREERMLNEVAPIYMDKAAA